MCIKRHHEHKHKFNCCCCPIIVGVVLIFTLNCLDLVAAVLLKEWLNVVIYGLVSLIFTISFVQRHRHSVRSHLFHSYAVAFVLSVIFMVWTAIVSD